MTSVAEQQTGLDEKWGVETWANSKKGDEVFAEIASGEYGIELEKDQRREWCPVSHPKRPHAGIWDKPTSRFECQTCGWYTNDGDHFEELLYQWLPKLKERLEVRRELEHERKQKIRNHMRKNNPKRISHHIYDSLDDAVRAADLPGFIGKTFPESGARPGKAGTWRLPGERSGSLSTFTHRGRWYFKVHDPSRVEGRASGNAYWFLVNYCYLEPKDAADLLLSGGV